MSDNCSAPRACFTTTTTMTTTKNFLGQKNSSHPHKRVIDATNKAMRPLSSLHWFIGFFSVCLTIFMRQPKMLLLLLWLLKNYLIDDEHIRLVWDVKSSFCPSRTFSLAKGGFSQLFNFREKKERNENEMASTWFWEPKRNGQDRTRERWPKKQKNFIGRLPSSVSSALKVK